MTYLGSFRNRLTVSEWEVLEALVAVEAEDRFKTKHPTVDEMAVAARAVVARFGTDANLKASLKSIVRSEGRSRSEKPEEPPRCEHCGRLISVAIREGRRMGPDLETCSERCYFLLRIAKRKAESERTRGVEH